MADFLTTPGGIALTIVAQCLAVLGFVMVSLLFLGRYCADHRGAMSRGFGLCNGQPAVSCIWR